MKSKDTQLHFSEKIVYMLKISYCVDFCVVLAKQNGKAISQMLLTA